MKKKDLLKDIMNFTIIYLAKLRLIWFKLKKQCLKNFDNTLHHFYISYFNRIFFVDIL